MFDHAATYTFLLGFLTIALPIAMYCLSTPETLLIGIAGGTASGKTRLAKKIRSAVADDVVIITQDSYYKDLAHLPETERAKANFDHPDSTDFILLRNHLLALQEGKTIAVPQYSFHTHTREPSSEEVNPTRVVIVEGILVFSIPEIRELFDIKIFVDTAADVRILRRIQRDIDSRGRNLDSVIHQYLSTVKPMHDEFVEPNKRYADVIIPSVRDNSIAINMIISKIRSVL